MDRVVIDCETTGLDPREASILGFSIASETTTKYYRWKKGDRVHKDAKKIIGSKEVEKWGHNLRFDRKMMRTNGIETVGPYFCSLLLAQMVDENQPLGLKKLSLRYLGPDCLTHKKALDAHLAALKLKMDNLGDPRVDQKLVENYCNEDTDNNRKIIPILLSKVNEKQMDYFLNELLPVEDVLMDMELVGLKVDTDLLNKADGELTTKISNLFKQLNDLIGEETQAVCNTIGIEKFNWNSAPQKVKLFYGKLGLGRFCNVKTDAGKPSLRGQILKTLFIPEGKLRSAIHLYLEYQAYTKLQSTYVQGIRERLKSGRIYGEFYQASMETFNEDDEGGTHTGRLSHRNPNLGNLTKKQKPGVDYWRGTFVKDLFVPDTENHCFGYADYSQIELRVAAHLSEDPVMLSAYNDKRDLHAETKDFIDKNFKMEIDRDLAKKINFAIIYGASGYRIRHELGWQNTEENNFKGQLISDALLITRFSVLGAWVKRNTEIIMRKGEISTMFGRVRHLPQVNSANKWEVAKAIRQGNNFIVQSAAASICKRAMVDLWKAGFDIRNQIHDALYIQVKKSEAEEKLKRMVEIMQKVVTLRVPLIADAKLVVTFLA